METISRHGLATLLVALSVCRYAFAQPPVLEPAVIWRAADPALPPNTAAMYRTAFSRDGQLVAVVQQNLQVRIRSSATGELVGELDADFSNRDDPSMWYDVAFSKSGNVALGALGRVEIYDGALAHLLTTFACGTCRVIEGLDFSPDDRLLAFQELRTHPERVQGIGSLHVVDTQSGAEVATLGATVGRANVRFSADGRTLFAMVTDVSPAESESLGFQRWRVSDWSAGRRSTAESWSFGTFALGRVANRNVALHADNGNLEMHDADDGGTIWSVPLLPPLFAPDAFEVELTAVALAPSGQFLVDYEKPRGASHDGALTVRRASDGQPVAVYDVPGVTDVDIAPNSQAFVFAAGVGTPHVAMVRVPPL